MGTQVKVCFKGNDSHEASLDNSDYTATLQTPSILCWNEIPKRGNKWS